MINYSQHIRYTFLISSVFRCEINHIAISGSRSLSQSFLSSNCRVMVKTSRLPLEFQCCLLLYIFKGISISGLGGHNATSGCPSLSYSFGNTIFKLAMVENLRLCHLNYSTIIFDQFYHVSQLQ